MILAGTWSLKIGIDAIKNDEKASAVHDPKLQIIPGAMSVVIGIIFLVKLVLIPLFEWGQCTGAYPLAAMVLSAAEGRDK